MASLLCKACGHFLTLHGARGCGAPVPGGCACKLKVKPKG